LLLHIIYGRAINTIELLQISVSVSFDFMSDICDLELYYTTRVWPILIVGQTWSCVSDSHCHVYSTKLRDVKY